MLRACLKNRFWVAQGDPPVPSGDPLDGRKATVRTNGDGLSAMLFGAVPFGGSPTGAGKLPALPFFRHALIFFWWNNFANKNKQETLPISHITDSVFARMISLHSRIISNRLQICSI